MVLHVAKLADKFWQVLRVAPVQFDPRPGWLLLAQPIGGKPKELKWVPPETRFEWVRPFNSHM